ncbi:hypothetical protein, partial [Salmonella enterica]|uniref:hypothetical protein n=1 Tax=Salmonella enterica TaxID=28901 RepID=UPI00147D189B
FLTGLDAGNPPWLGVTTMNHSALIGEIVSDIRVMEVIVGKVVFDRVALVAAADDEVVNPVGRIDLHDVPQDRPIADFDHR